MNRFVDEMSRQLYRVLTGVKPLSPAKDTTRRLDSTRAASKP